MVSGRKPGRLNGHEITLFKSVGMAVEDIATASYAYRQALAAGIGTWLDMEGLAEAGDRIAFELRDRSRAVAQG